MRGEQRGRRKTIAAGLLIGYGVMILLLAADQWTKYLAATSLTDTTGDMWALSSHWPVVPFIPHVLSFQYVQNYGVAFGALSGMGGWILGANIVLLAALLLCHFRLLYVGAAKRLPLEILLLFVCAGAAGNILDRLRLGYVVDFLHFDFINFPVFNLADVYVTCSVAVLFFLMVFYYRENELGRLFGRKKEA